MLPGQHLEHGARDAVRDRAAQARRCGEVEFTGEHQGRGADAAEAV
ncbi:hypothetical protein ACQEVN_03050 [Streptomyces iakyrus]